MRKLSITVCLMILLSAFSRLPLSSEEPLVVTLEVDSPLLPLSITPFEQIHSRFENSHLEKCETLLLFDLNNNGKTTIRNDAEASRAYAISGEFKDDALILTLRLPGEQYSLRTVLTGNEGQDSRAIHALSDKIHEQLFGAPGVASTRILFTKRTTSQGKERSDLWECDYNGAQARQVLEDAGYCVTPNYIPPAAGQRPAGIIYVSYKTGQPKIYGASLSGGTGKPLLHLSGNQLMPTISRQRDSIAFISDVTGNPDLFMQNFDPERGVWGKPRHLYTAPHATQGTPAFSPDGSRIAFVSDKSGTERIYVLTIPPKGTPVKDMPLTLISKFTRGNTAPCWSPDGTKIAYCAKIGEHRQIMVYDLLTGKERQLTKGPGNKENPAWAPNSLHLVYNTADPHASELYILNLTQGTPYRISSGSGDKRFPCWEPRS